MIRCVVHGVGWPVSAVTRDPVARCGVLRWVMRKGPDGRSSGPFAGVAGQPITACASISTSIGSCGSSTKIVVRQGFTPPGLMFSSMNSA